MSTDLLEYRPQGEGHTLIDDLLGILNAGTAAGILPEATDEVYPFLLLTGRGTSSQWHTQTRTGKSAVLRKLYPKQI
jgi:hypothetical protein